MSYIENIPLDEMSKYEIIPDWDKYFKEKIGEKTDATGIAFLFNIEVRNSIIESEVNFLGGTYDFSIRFEYCYFKKSISFADSKFTKDFIISNSYIDNSISSLLQTNLFEATFMIVSTHLKTLLIMEGKFNKCIWNIEDCDGCYLFKTEFKDLSLIIGDKGINEFRISSPELRGSILISGEGHRVNKFILENISKDLTLSLEELNVGNLYISKYRNEAGLRLSNIKSFSKIGEFSIADSYLGKAEFYSFDFTSFGLVNIRNSSIVDSAFVNTKFSNNIDAFECIGIEMSKKDFDVMESILILEKRKEGKRRGLIKINNDPKIREYYTRKREIMRQLKYALSKQDDTVNEQRFHSLEMKAYDRSLTWKSNLWTKLIIKASSWTSEFGQSVRKPLLFLLFGNFVFFSILLVCNVFWPLQVSFHNSTWEGFWIGINEYFKLINPLRKPEDIFKGGFIIIDLLIRIWSSYMIYNIIRASRRFIK